MKMSSQWSVKRVPVNFDWPIGYPWHGYTNPWPAPNDCDECGATGLNERSQNLYANFRRWAYKITPEEVELAVQGGISGKELSQIRRRDWVNVDTHTIRFTLTEIRAKRLGFWGVCGVCNGKQVVPNQNPAVRQLYKDVNLYEEWVPIEPPRGDGWQLWKFQDNTGYPVSPVVQNEGDLAKWCSIHFKSDYMSWLNWVSKEGSKKPPKPEEFKLHSENVVVFHQPTSKS